MSDFTVLLTGAAGALGQAVAAHFAARPGSRLVLLDRHAEALHALAAKFPNTPSLPLATDLLDAQAVAAAAAQAVQRFGAIDASVHIAGGFAMGDAVHETPAATLAQMIELNVGTMLHCAAAVVPVMKRQRRGFIVNIGAHSALRGAALQGAYIASKSALLRLTESMSAELREQGIHVNAVLPSILDTPANRRAMPDADPARWVAPAALASVIGFLCSDAAGAVHGALIPVTGLS